MLAEVPLAGLSFAGEACGFSHAPLPTGSAEHKPRAVLLADAFTVDEDGFLVAAGAR